MALAVFLGAAPTLPLVLAATTTFYVNSSAANCNDGGSGGLGQPFCTIGKGAQVAQAGDTVVVVGGTYAGTSVNPTRTGVAGSPITFAASPGVTITGGVSGFAISGKSYIVIDGFAVNSTSSSGIAVSSSSHITISNNRVTGAGQRVKNLTAAGISLSSTTSSLVTRNTSDNNSDHGIFVFGGSATNTISFNEASLNAEGWQRNANGINVIDSGSTGNTVLGNVLHDNEDSGLQFFSGANNGLAIANVSYNNGDHGIDDYNVTGGRLIGNTIYHNCADGINVEGTSGNYTVMNNIAVDNAVYPAYKGISCSRRTGNIGIYDSAPASTVADYNLVNLTTSGALYVWNSNSYSSLTALRQATGQEAHGLQGDPRWVSQATANFRLLSGSPAIDSANAAASGESSVDADGHPRIDDPSTPNTGNSTQSYDDRGAYEFQTIDTVPPTTPTGLAAAAPGPNQVSLTWYPSTDNVGVAGYTVYRNGLQIGTAPSASYTDASVAASTTYSYAVDAYDFGGNHSTQSTPASVTTPAPDTQPPTIPAGLSAPGSSANSVNLQWNAASDNIGVTGYTVYRGGTAVGTPPSTSFTDVGLTPGTSYTYTVDAFDGAGNHSSQSAAITATTAVQSAAYVRGATYSSGGRLTVTTIVLSGPVAAGDLLTGLFGQWDATGQVQVSDNVNGPWTRVRGITYSTGKGDIALYQVANSRASGSGLTITISASSATYLSGAVGEYSGLATTSPLDQSALRSGSGTSVDSGATNPVPAGEVIFAAMITNNNPGTVTAGSSAGVAFTLRSRYGDTAAADIVSGAAGAQSARFTLTNSTPWYALVATYSPTIVASDTTPPTSPAGLAAGNGTRSVSLTWNASTDNVGVSGYTVYRGGAPIGTVAGSVLAYSDTTVAAATTYTYTVDAFDAAGNHSAPSSAVTDTTNDWVAPSVPAGLTATVSGPTQVTLSWSASTDNVAVAGYTVYRNGSTLASVNGATLTYTDSAVSAGTTYSYTVDALDTAANHSAQSASSTVTLPAGPDVTAPTAPTGLAASAPAQTQVNLTWSASSDDVGVSGYTIFRDGAALTTVAGSTLAYTDSTVAAATTYSYAVDAFDAAGNHSAQSAPAAVTTPGGADTTAPSTPGGVAATVTGASQVRVTWTASTDDVGVTGYTVYRNGASVATVAGGTLTYIDNAVSPSTDYSYTVDAFDAAGNRSAQSTPGAVHTPGQIRFVQGKVFTSGGRVTTATVTFGPVTQGDLLVGWYGQYDSPGQVSVSDSVNGAWTRAAASTTWNGSAGDIALYYFANSAAAPGGITITITAASATYLQGSPADYSGVATVNPLDKVVIAKGSGTSADSGLTAATGAGELVYGGMVATSGAGTVTPGTSQGVTFVKRAQSNSGSQVLFDIVASAAGQQHAALTLPNSVPWFIACAVFKPA